MEIRNVCPNDYNPIIHVLDAWWGGRRMSDMLPKLFFVHFCETSFIAEMNSEVVGFLIGFLSQTHAEEAYIHFAGIHPDFRNQGVGSALYKRFFQTVQKLDRVRVRCVTSPVNKGSIAYHLHMGFEAELSETQEDGVPYHSDYDGVGEHRVLFVKHL
ncbi:MAG: GNAT family N-acetyltransferase [Leptolyngbyaceae cyanobacterium RM2_2_4]|nr:GNAT family N-acetyltransferase [Leptolyngbyaceae cyanobacterium RM2_2_4]